MKSKDHLQGIVTYVSIFKHPPPVNGCNHCFHEFQDYITIHKNHEETTCSYAPSSSNICNISFSLSRNTSNNTIRDLKSNVSAIVAANHIGNANSTNNTVIQNTTNYMSVLQDCDNGRSYKCELLVVT